MKERNIKIGLHITAWMIFFSLPLLLVPRNVEQVVRNPFQFLVINVLLVIFYYLNAYYLVPRYLSQKKIYRYILYIFLFLAIFLYLPYTYTATYNTPPSPIFPSYPIGDSSRPHTTHPVPADSTPYPYIGKLRANSPAPLYNKYGTGANNKRSYFQQLFSRMNSIILFLLVFVLSTGVQLLSELFDTRRKKQDLEHQKSKAELAFLRSQTNPHFFFNILNSLYALSLTKSEQTPDAIMKLSGIMRYVITETDKDFVPLTNEIDYIQQYIDLQKLRLPEKTKVNFVVEGNSDNKIIAPLIFIFYIENAFKYGLSASVDALIDIRLSIENSKLEFKISNQKFDYTTQKEKTSIGLENVKQRLELLYPHRYQLDILENEKEFHVRLCLFFSTRQASH